MDRYIITWIRNGLRYAAAVGHKFTAEAQAERLKLKEGYSEVEYYTKKQFDAKFKDQLIHSPRRNGS